MKIKSLTCLIAVLFVVGFSGSALAVLDATGDEICPNKDLLEVDVLYFDAASDPADDAIKVGVEMNSGSSLPGMIMFEVDVDDDATTGGAVSMAGVMRSCDSGCTTKIKEQAGTDILVMVMIRDQTKLGGTSWCDGCTGPGGQCFLRGDTCAGACGGTDCYKAGTGCDAGDPDCYVAGDPCNEPRPTCDTCYELTNDCSASNPCNIGRVQGEWYADVSASGQGGTPPAAKGRIDMPLPNDADTGGTTDAFPLPWGRIVTKCRDKLIALGVDPLDIYDLAEAQDPANFRYQLSVWYDVDDTNPPANDFFDEAFCTPGCAEVCDIVPNAGLAPLDTTKGCAGGCNGDFDTDADVDGTDAVNFKAHFFRKNCLNTDLRAR